MDPRRAKLEAKIARAEIALQRAIVASVESARKHANRIADADAQVRRARSELAALDRAWS